MKAAFGVAPITPDVPVYLAGFGARTEPAREVFSDLQARALVLTEGSTTLCLVVCDLLGMSPGYSNAAREAIASALDTPVECVLVSCTHTHAGPSAMAGTEALGWPNPDGYVERVRDGCLAAATAAHEVAAPATLHFLRAPLPDGFSFNRRGLPYEQPWFSVLDVLGDDERIGLVANMSIHPVLLGPEWLAVAPDWIGPFRTAIEAHAGGVAIELTGSLGDINPTPPEGRPDDTYAPWASSDQTNAFGERLATHVVAALDGADELAPTLAVVRSETESIPVGGTPIAALLGEPALDVDFVEWSIGDVRLVSIPGEAFHALGREISSARNDRVLLAGISPAWHGYLPRPWGEGYEEGVSYGEGFVGAVSDRLRSAP